MNIWQSEKVRLRAIEPSDAQYFIHWDLNSERARHLDFVWPPISQSSVQAWVEEQSRKKLENDQYHWIIENNNGEPVGSIDSHHCQPRNGTFSYGIYVAPEHQRKGYASEAILIVLRYYFEELRYQKVTVPVHSNNEASIRLHQKLGFVEEGSLRRMVYTDGQFYDEVWFGMTREEYLIKNGNLNLPSTAGREFTPEDR